MCIRVRLQKKHVRKARKLARLRDEGKPNICHDGEVTQGESEYRHNVGTLGEVAFEEEWGYELDESIRRGGDPGYDFLTEYGVKIDVKTRDIQRSGKDLALGGEGTSDFLCDVMVLCWWRNSKSERLPILDFRGWCTKEMIEDPNVYKIEAFGPNGLKRLIEPEDLRGIDELRFHLFAGTYNMKKSRQPAF